MATYASGFERDTSSNNNPRRNTRKIFKLVIAARLLTMKYLLLMSTLTTSLMCSAGSWAEWTEVSEDTTGTKVYVDFDKIHKIDGFAYYWSLTDFLEPAYELLSVKMYAAADCKAFRFMQVSLLVYKLPMAEGDDYTLVSDPDPDPKWKYAPPDSVSEGILQAVCAH